MQDQMFLFADSLWNLFSFFSLYWGLVIFQPLCFPMLGSRSLRILDLGIFRTLDLRLDVGHGRSLISTPYRVLPSF